MVWAASCWSTSRRWGARHGVRRFEAEVLADNYGMLRVFRAPASPAARATEEGEVQVELRTDASREAVEAADRREWRSQARSLRPLLPPTSVAVVGVRRSAGGFGFGVVEAIRSSAFAGPLRVVHPEATGSTECPPTRACRRSASRSTWSWSRSRPTRSPT